MGEFVRYAQAEILKMPPLSKLMSRREWLDDSHYSMAAERRLQVEFEKLGGCPPKRPGAKKSFTKTERYTGYKYHRCINACTVEEKTFLGPTMKSVEHAFYRYFARYLLKGIPTHLRSRELFERLHAGLFLGLDFSAFESGVLREYAVGIESFLVNHLAGHLAPAECEYFARSCAAPRVLDYGKWVGTVHHGRCSGDLNTSFCNALINLLMVRFVCGRHGYDPVGVVEGDDGLFVLGGSPPTVEEFAELGFAAKIDLFDSISDAGFCKMKFGDDLVQIADPIEKLVKFGWTSSNCTSQRVRWSLLFTKALSLKAEFPDCPILGPFADWIVRCCRESGHKLSRRFDEDKGWTASKLEKGLVFRPSRVLSSTRAAMSAIYSIPRDTQLALEASFVGPLHYLDLSAVQSRCPAVWADAWNAYVTWQS